MICRTCGGTSDRPKNQCRACYNAYMNEYMKARYHRRRSEFIDSRGRVCAKCYSTGPEFEIDHVDQFEKKFDIAKALASWSDKRLLPELEKSQVLCVECHREKTRVDLSKRFGQRTHWEHGTLAGYRHCRCPECKSAKSAYAKNYRITHKPL